MPRDRSNSNGEPGDTHSNSVPAQSQASVQKQMLAMAMRKKSQSDGIIPDDEEFSKEYPNLFQWLVTTRIADKFQRDPPRLNFQVDGGSWKINLSDDALGCSLSQIGNSFRECLDRLEKAILHPDSVWQYWRVRREALREIKEPTDKDGR